MALGNMSHLEVCLSEKIVIIWRSSYFHRCVPTNPSMVSSLASSTSQTGRLRGRIFLLGCPFPDNEANQ